MTANSAVGLAEKSFRHTSVLVLHAFKTHGRHTVGRGILSGRQCQKCLRHFGTNLKLCKHLAYSAVCRKSLQAAGHFADLEPGQGHAKATAADLSKAPVLQADGPTLPFDSLQWEDEPDRPVAEFLECLRLIGFDFDLDNPDEVWERVRIAFSCVCVCCHPEDEAHGGGLLGGASCDRGFQLYGEPAPSGNHGVDCDC